MRIFFFFEKIVFGNKHKMYKKHVLMQNEKSTTQKKNWNGWKCNTHFLTIGQGFYYLCERNKTLKHATDNIVELLYDDTVFVSYETIEMTVIIYKKKKKTTIKFHSHAQTHKGM